MKSLRTLIEQYGLMAVAIMVAIGFSGVFTYSSLVDTGSTGNTGQQEGPQMPSGNIVRGVSNLTLREKAYLGNRNDVVFVTVMEVENSSVNLDASSLVSDFNNRLYINFVDGSSSPLARQLGYNQFPRAVAVSGAIRNRRVAPRVEEANLTESGIRRASCLVLKNWGQALRSMCYPATR